MLGRSVMIKIKLFFYPLEYIKEINNPVAALKINEFLITLVSSFYFWSQ